MTAALAHWLVVDSAVGKRSKRSGVLPFKRRSNADEKTLCSKLAKVAATRFNIEMCFKLGKGETGLDQYEVRHYHSWYRHITLSMMALAWLVVTKHRLVQAESRG